MHTVGCTLGPDRLALATAHSAAILIGKLIRNPKMPLTANQVKSKPPGVHADSGGLYLVVRDSGERIWQFRFTALDGKRAAMEFARVGDRDDGERVTLSTAREIALGYRITLKRDGIDPRR